RRRSQCAVTKRDEFLAASIAGARIFKNFLGFEIEEAQTHGAASQDSFEMALAAAAAELFLGIQANDRMPAFPDSFPGRQAAEADAVAESPHAERFVDVGLGRGACRGPGVRLSETV